MNVPCSSTTLGMLLRQVRDVMRAAMERELAETGSEITFSQFIALRKLSDGVNSPGELARAVELNPGAMTRLLDQLETKGLVQRHPDPSDRRALLVTATPKAEALFPAFRDCAERVRQRALAGVSEADQLRLAQLLEQVRDNLQLMETP